MGLINSEDFIPFMETISRYMYMLLCRHTEHLCFDCTMQISKNTRLMCAFLFWFHWENCLQTSGPITMQHWRCSRTNKHLVICHYSWRVKWCQSTWEHYFLFAHYVPVWEILTLCPLLRAGQNYKLGLHKHKLFVLTFYAPWPIHLNDVQILMPEGTKVKQMPICTS